MMKHTKHLLVLWAALLLGAGNAWGATYKLVTTTDDLVAGSNYIIGSAESGSAVFISTASNTNNRKQSASVTITNSEITLANDILVLELGGSSGSWTFKTTNYAGTAGYLNATSTTSSNYLKVVSTDDKYNKFSISFNNNAAVITCTGKTSRNIIRYNSATSGGQLFSCYSSGQAAVYLYKEVGTSSTTLYLGQELELFWNPARRFAVFGTPPVASRFLEPHPSLRSSSPLKGDSAFFCALKLFYCVVSPF